MREVCLCRSVSLSLCAMVSLFLSLSLLIQSFLALARGQIPPSFVMTPVTSALNGVPQQISIQNQLAQLEKLQKEQQQHMQQQQLQAQQQHMQQQQHQLQQQQHLQLQQMLQQRAAMQGGTLPTIPGIPAQMLQGQVRGSDSDFEARSFSR